MHRHLPSLADLFILKSLLFSHRTNNKKFIHTHIYIYSSLTISLPILPCHPLLSVDPPNYIQCVVYVILAGMSVLVHPCLDVH